MQIEMIATMVRNCLWDHNEDHTLENKNKIQKKIVLCIVVIFGQRGTRRGQLEVNYVAKAQETCKWLCLDMWEFI